MAPLILSKLYHYYDNCKRNVNRNITSFSTPTAVIVRVIYNFWHFIFIKDFVQGVLRHGELINNQPAGKLAFGAYKNKKEIDNLDWGFSEIDAIRIEVNDIFLSHYHYYM